MNTEQFVKEYNETTDKEKFVKKHILKDKYIPYAEKVAICKRIVNSTSYVKSGEIKTYRKNTPGQYMLFVLNVIDLYTDIDIDFTDAPNEFDKVYPLNVSNIICSVCEAEINTLNTVLKMIEDDLEINERTLVSYIENKISLLETILGDTDKLKAKLESFVNEGN